jgi:hypothetical protein
LERAVMAVHLIRWGYPSMPALTPIHAPPRDFISVKLII